MLIKLSMPLQVADAPASIRFDNLIEAAGEAVFLLNLEGDIRYASKRAQALIGVGVILIGKPIADLVTEADRYALAQTQKQALASVQGSRIELRLNTRSASVWFELLVSVSQHAGGPIELLVIGRDISLQHANEERLRHIATHDGLTGLPNRALLADRLRMAIAQARRVSAGFSVLTLGLDGFKKVNDALGYVTGDALLCVAGDRLRATLRDVDTLAHVGGDEFVAILPGAVDEATIQNVARRMIASIQLPFDIDGHVLYVSTSIGAACYPQHGDTDVKLLAHADAALRRAKDTGKARCIVFQPEKFGQVDHDVSMEAAMFDGVRHGEFLLYYQPIVDARTRHIMGFEALMRWMHPELGMVPPIQFIPMAESNGLINLLGAWALKAACMQIKQFEKVIGRPLYVSVNVSPRQFRNDQFLEVMDDAMRLSGLRGEQLLLEITEGILMSDPEHAEALLHQITARKVRIAIDDFGTGYSSLAYLKRFPIATLKIDRAFIKDLPDSVKDSAICNVVLNLASNLNLLTVAEGVENEQQLEFLASRGCTLIQGYHTGRPLAPDAALAILHASVNATSIAPGRGAPLAIPVSTSMQAPT